MKVSRRELAATLAASLAWTACKRQQSAAAPIRVGIAPKVTHAAVHLADEKGLFRHEGLDIRFSEFPGDAEMLSAITRGNLDVAMTGFSAGIANAVGLGAKIRIVAGRDSLKPGCSDQGALYYRRARFPSGIEYAPDWEGARIALPESNMMSAFYLDRILDYEDVPESAVQTFRLKMEQAVAAAAGGHIDLFFGSGRPEFLPGGLPKEIGRSDLLMKALGEFQYTYVLFGASLLAGDVQRGIAFLRAYLRGVRRFVAGETPQYLTDLAARMHLDPNLVKAGCRSNVSATGEIEEEDVEKWLAWAIETRIVTAAVTTEQLLDLRFQGRAAISV